MIMDETLRKISDKVKNYAMIWLVDLTEGKLSAVLF